MPETPVANLGRTLEDANRQRAAFGLRAATPAELTSLDAMRATQSVESGFPLLPGEEPVWVAFATEQKVAHDAITRASSDPAYLEAAVAANQRDYTVYARSDGVDRVRAVVKGTGVAVAAAGFSFEDGQAEIDRVIGSRSTDERAGLTSYGVSHDMWAAAATLGAQTRQREASVENATG
jgi:hypothetical protein